MCFFGGSVVGGCAGFRGSVRPKCSAARFCAGMGYLFLRRKEKCSRLRGNQLPNPPGMLCGDVLRGNGLPNPRGGPCGIFLCGDGGCGDGVMGDFVYIYGVIF